MAAHRIGNCPRLSAGPETIGLQLGIGLGIVSIRGSTFPFRIKPFGRVGTGLSQKARVHFPIVSGKELANFFFALDHHRQRWRLHAAHCRQKETAVTRVEGRHGPRTVDADHPVGFGARASGIGQTLHLFFAAQALETVPYRRGRHGLQPQAPDRVFAFGVLLDQAKNQFALAARVTGINDVAHILALGQLDDGVEPRLGFVHRLEVEVRRNHRQIRKTPLAALDIKLFGRLNLDQVANSRSDHPVVAFKILVVLFEFARCGRHRPHDVLSH